MPNSRRRVRSGAPWEARVAYCRAIRVGDRIEVAGTLGLEPDGTLAPGDAYAQARRALVIIAAALEEIGADMSAVVRTRMYVTDIGASLEAVGRAHREVFEGHEPVATMVEVAALARPEALVEIEVSALA